MQKTGFNVVAPVVGAVSFHGGESTAHGPFSSTSVWRIHHPTKARRDSIIQWIFQVPLKGGIGGIVHPPIGRKNTTYILPSGGLYNPYHPLQEPEKSIE